MHQTGCASSFPLSSPPFHWLPCASLTGPDRSGPCRCFLQPERRAALPTTGPVPDNTVGGRNRAARARRPAGCVGCLRTGAPALSRLGDLLEGFAWAGFRSGAWQSRRTGLPNERAYTSQQQQRCSPWPRRPSLRRPSPVETGDAQGGGARAGGAGRQRGGSPTRRTEALRLRHSPHSTAVNRLRPSLHKQVTLPLLCNSP